MDLDTFKNTVKQGDVLLFSGTGWIARRIQAATNSPWSHVAMSVGHEFIVEATWPRSRVTTITDRLNVERIQILRKREQTDLQRTRRALWACTRSGWRYDAKSLSWWLLPDWLRGRKNWLSSERPICSEQVAWAFWKNEEPIFPDHETVAPVNYDGHPALAVIADIPGA